MKPVTGAQDVAELRLDQSGTLEISSAEDVQRFLKVLEILLIDLTGLRGETVEHGSSSTSITSEGEDIILKGEIGRIRITVDHGDPGYERRWLGGGVEFGEVEQDTLVDGMV